MNRANLMWLIVASFAILGMLFNIFQIIIIISGQYNRPANIESPILAMLVAIFPTLIWLIVTLIVLSLAIIRIRHA